MKVLRPGPSGRSELRVLFASDPQQSAIMLIAGEKAGELVALVQEERPVG